MRLGCADARRPGPGGAVPKRPVRGQAGEGSPARRRSTSPSRRPRRGAAFRSRPNCAGRSTRISLKLFYQPLINEVRRGRRVRGAGPLEPRDRGEISPTEFIPVAEESGLILSSAVGDGQSHANARRLGHAGGRDAAALRRRNLSAIQVAATISPTWSPSALKSSGLSGERLTLELTKARLSRTRRVRRACSMR